MSEDGLYKKLRSRDVKVSRKGNGSKRRKVEATENTLVTLSVAGEVFIEVLLGWLSSHPEYGNSHLVVCRALRTKGRRICTNRFDVRDSNLTWMGSLSDGSSFDFVKHMALNGDLVLLHKLFGTREMTSRSKIQISKAAFKLNDLDMYRYSGIDEGPKYIISKTVTNGWVSLLEQTLAENPNLTEEPLNTLDIHARIFDHYKEKHPDLLKKWVKHVELVSVNASHGNLETLKRLHDYGVSMKYETVYFNALWNNETEIMQWAHEILYKNEAINWTGKSFTGIPGLKLCFKHHGEECMKLFVGMQVCQQDLVEWHAMAKEKTVSMFFMLFNDHKFKEIMATEWNFRLSERCISSIDFDILHPASLELLLHFGLPLVPLIFAKAVDNSSLELCYYLHHKYPQISIRRWGAYTMGDYIADARYTEEKLDWFTSLGPYNLRSLADFAYVCMYNGLKKAFRWAFQRLSVPLQEALADYANDMDQPIGDNDFPFLVPIMEFLPSAGETYSGDMSLTRHKTISEYLKKKDFFPNYGVKIMWPDDFEFFDKNIQSHEWNRNLDFHFRHTWSERNYQKYLENRHRYIPKLEKQSKWNNRKGKTATSKKRKSTKRKANS